MFATKVLRQAAAHAERQPSIKFIGKRSIPSTSLILKSFAEVLQAATAADVQ